MTPEIAQNLNSTIKSSYGNRHFIKKQQSTLGYTKMFFFFTLASGDFSETLCSHLHFADCDVRGSHDQFE